MDRSRRDFLKVSALGMAASLLPRPLLARSARAEFTPLRRNVGIFTERGGTIGWLVNDQGVLVVDSQFADTAPIFLEGLKQRSSRPIDVLINSHHHGDHTGGNAVLRGTARQIVAHTRSAENQRNVARQSGAEATLPDVTFSDSWSVQIGDETVRAKHYGPAHTGGDVAIFFEQANVVHLGDLINNRAYPNVDGPAGASVQGWVRVLEAIVADHAPDTLYIFGHGEPEHGMTGSRDDLNYQRDYFTAVLEAAGRAIREGRSREETAAMESLAGFEHFGGAKARLGLGLGVAYDELSSSR